MRRVILLFVFILAFSPSLRATSEWKLTAYCPCPICTGHDKPAPTAAGVWPVADFTIAADPEVLPIGSIVRILGREYMVQDVGSAVDGHHIDIFFRTHKQALQFGVQYADVEVVHVGSSTRR